MDATEMQKTDTPTVPQSTDSAVVLGITPAAPVSMSELAELDFLRYEAAHLQARVRDLEKQLSTTQRERDTIQHERNLMAQDFQWTLDRLDTSPLAPVLRRAEGFRRLQAKWGNPAS